ncbi:MAG: hypothetical protein RBU45_22810 [Myxococcota bacterium]|jgi:mRNA interferase HicA|nr:hypothetical protein [Myxococcota bacterium]
MNGAELLRKLKRIARQRGLELRVVTRQGKGSHSLLLLGDRRTILKDQKKEISPGLLAAMLADLGLTKDEL